MMRGLDSFAVDTDVTFFDQPLQRTARGGGEFFAKKLVQPLLRQRFFDGEIFRA
jgi:hypothetical protein